MQKIYKFFHRYIYPLIFLYMPIKKQKIVFSSFAGKQYSDNPRVISEKLCETNSRLDIVWLLNNIEESSNINLPNVRVVKNESFKAAFELYTAGIWIDNCRKPLFYKKRKAQYYIQCWHGTPLKLIEEDAGNKLGNRYRKYALRDSKNIDLLISGNEYSTKIFKRAFRYEGEILECGTPRNDILVNYSREVSVEVRKKLGISNEKLILYSPTFRNDTGKNGYAQLAELNPIGILKAFEQKYEKKCILLLRFHPNVAGKLDYKEFMNKYDNNIIDVSLNWDMQDLLCCADVLISDYSSVMFDYSLLCRPIYLFIPDYEDYKGERGLYYDLEKLPLLYSKSSVQLLNQITNEDDERLSKRTISLLSLIGNKETGNATCEIIKKIYAYLYSNKVEERE